jgi:hypothetical protein
MNVMMVHALAVYVTQIATMILPQPLHQLVIPPTIIPPLIQPMLVCPPPFHPHYHHRRHHRYQSHNHQQVRAGVSRLIQRVEATVTPQVHQHL